jgi:hypothetical protein
VASGVCNWVHRAQAGGAALAPRQLGGGFTDRGLASLLDVRHIAAEGGSMDALFRGVQLPKSLTSLFPNIVAVVPNDLHNDLDTSLSMVRPINGGQEPQAMMP